MATGGLTPPQIEALLEGPALVAPPGQTYNFINPENSSYNWYIFTLTICFGVSTFAVLIRIYTRVKIIKIHGFEDCKFHIVTPTMVNIGHQQLMYL